MTSLIGVVKGPTIQAAKEQIAKAKKFADLVEIRLDLFEPKALNQLQELPQDLPVIFTFRKKAQGGARDLSERERLDLFEKCLKKREPAYCDIEADTELAFFESIHQRFPKMRIIGSFHDFLGIPPHLDQVFERMYKPQISHYKIAVMANSTNEALQVMAFAKKREHLTCIAMGVDGNVSRILSPLVGSDFCYAAIEEADAPLGQLSLETLCQIYHFKKLTPHTRIYALLGHPVNKSIGHLFHNKSFPSDAVYVKLSLQNPELPLFFSLARQFAFHGFSVTMPLKEQLGRFLTRLDPAAEAIKSVNTVALEENHFVGYNTDGAGAMNALEKHQLIQGVCIALLGAGGSGRAVAYEAMRRGATMVVLNRTLSRAEALAADFGCKAVNFEDLDSIPYDVLINTIPADLIFDPQSFKKGKIIMDIIYWEQQTSLLKIAHDRGCVCIGGIKMFEEQAKLQQKIWFQNN